MIILLREDDERYFLFRRKEIGKHLSFVNEQAWGSNYFR